MSEGETRYHYPTARAWKDVLSGGRWVVSPWDECLGVPTGDAIGMGDTRAAAWADAEAKIESRLDAARNATFDDDENAA